MHYVNPEYWSMKHDKRPENQIESSIPCLNSETKPYETRKVDK